MSTATKSQWEGRLGIEAVGRMGGCCAQTMLKWRPQMIGQRNSCAYCGTVMKAVRAGEAEAPAYTGGLNEHLRERATPELVLGGLYFESGKFPTTEKADEWMDDRDILAKAEELDMHAHYAPIERLLPETVRAVWAAPGVIAEIGVAEKQVATGGGQASMHSPGLTTTSMASGGTSHPAQQGPAAIAVGQGGQPTLISGMVEMNDGHQHEIHLTPYPANDGWRVKGYTSFNNGHAHVVEGHVNKDGSVDLHTNPDQSPVGGHAHRHRLVWRPGAAADLPKAVAKGGDLENADGREYRVTSQDVVTLRRAAGLIKTFCEGVGGDRDSVTGAIAASMSQFQDQLGRAIERARGQVAHREGFVYLAKEDLSRLGSAGKFVGEFGERIAGGIGMEKDLEGDPRPFAGSEPDLDKAQKGEKVEPGSLKGGKSEPSSGDEPGEGGRFAALSEELENKEKKGVRDPKALAAAIGRAKYGKKKFQEMAAAGRRKANKDLPEVDAFWAGITDPSIPFAEFKEFFREFREADLEKQVDFARPTVDEINAVSEAAGKGNPGQIEHLIEWVGDVGVAECIESVRASDRASARVDDPIKVCGWLKAQSNEAAQTAEEA